MMLVDFYGRTGNVTLTSSDHITTGDITSRNFKFDLELLQHLTFGGAFTGTFRNISL